jgi:error-prone DNA polymerase
LDYVELHCHTNFSFLEGASHPEELVLQAAELGLPAVAVTDHNGLYGAPRFAEAARKAGLAAIVGAEVEVVGDGGKGGWGDGAMGRWGDGGMGRWGRVL